MKKFGFLIMREWWEWRKVIYWTLGVYVFLLLLSYLPANRTFTHMTGLVDIEMDDIGNHHRHGEKLLEQILNNIHDPELIDELDENAAPLITAYSTAIIAIFHSLEVLMLFIALFYFSDSLFKERNDCSTLFFRSQPIPDHSVILSKIAAGALGLLLTTLVMSIIGLIHTKLLIMVLTRDAADLFLPVLGRIQICDLFMDMMVFQLVAFLWLSPLIMFLIVISATVKNRPLIIGIGAPILLIVISQLVFQNHELAESIGNIFVAIGRMQTEQILVGFSHSLPEGAVEVLGSYWGYLFAPRTLISLIISGIFYGITWIVYRLNIPTS